MHDLDLAKHFAFLLHPEITEVEREDWWLVMGRSAFPYWSYLNESEVVDLRQSVGQLEFGNQSLPISRAMSLTLTLRQDVFAKFSDYADPTKALAGWFFAIGIKEHLLTEMINQDLLRQLDKSVKILPDGSANQFNLPAPSILMVLIWHMLDRKMQSSLDLNSQSSCQRFFAWFFCIALDVFRLEFLLAGRWKSWLLEPIPLIGGQEFLPRFAVLATSLMKENERPDLGVQSGVITMREWVSTQTSVSGKWYWLVSDIKKPTPVSRFEPVQISDAADKSDRPQGLNLIGFAFGELGIGEDLRMAVEACEAANIPHKVVNINLGKEIRQEDHSLMLKVHSGIQECDYSINVFIMPGFDMASRIFLRCGNEMLKDHYNIGWWPWELSVWPKAWDCAFDLVDEVWAGSEFSYEMYQKSTSKLVHFIPLAASVERSKSFSRSHYSLPVRSDLFLFLYIFDFNSHLKRKNPEATISAFKLAFGESSSHQGSVGLVLKVMNVNPKDQDWLAFVASCKGDKRIHIINKTLDRSEVLGLIQTCDAYISPHRAEGFGRTLAEAMLFGKPVIATNYSGNKMYMNPEVTLPVKFKLIPLKEGDYHFIKNEDKAEWAEPSVNEIAKRMVQAIDKSKEASYESKIKAYAKKIFSPVRTGDCIKNSLNNRI